MNVTDVMSRSIATCSVSATIEEAERLMREQGVRRLVVVDREGHACGLLSLDDIAHPTQDAASISDLKAFVETSIAALAMLRAEIRHDVELSGEAVRLRWLRVEARLEAAEICAREARREAARQLAEAIRSAIHFRRLLHEGAATP
jgi:signal-transduction protein with cAMP-binding, CBS, and nucleotidyltransferase domain